MNAEEDARATWELLSETERALLAGLRSGYIVTPRDAGSLAGITWQRAASHMRELKALGLVIINSRPKQTDYELSGQGRACLQAGQGKRPLMWSEVCVYAQAAGTPDSALVADDRGHAVYTTTPSLDGERVNLRVTPSMSMALTWQQMRDYAGVRPIVEAWFADPEPRPVTGVRLVTGASGAVLQVQGRAEQ